MTSLHLRLQRGPDSEPGHIMPKKLHVELASDERVSALLYPAGKPHRGEVTLILAHGAGAGQTSDFMTSFAATLAARGLNVVTFNFLYMEQGRRVPDASQKLEACFEAVVTAVRKRNNGPLIIGGKSMGGRIASQLASSGVEASGLLLLGYPLHPPGKPPQMRTKHLPAILCPMLFVQGARDPFGTPDELRPVLAKLKGRSELYVVEGGDHSFKVLKRAGISQDSVYEAVFDRIELWVKQRLAA